MGAKRKTHEEYISQLSTINKNIIPIEPYELYSKPIMHRCTICEFTWKVKPNNLLSTKKSGCPSCSGRIVTNSEYISRLPEDIKALQPYINSRTKITHKHIKCGYEWEASPGNILSGYGCPYCVGASSNTVYLVYFSELNLYKIGVAKNVYLRQYGFGQPSVVVHKETYSTEPQARQIEKILLDKVKNLMYDSGILKSGNTETFRAEKAFIDFLKEEWKHYG